MSAVCASIEPVDGVSVRPWSLDDATTLVAAWNDPVIARWNPVPPDSSIEFARGWIEGAAVQVSTDRGIDVVMIREKAVVGEIGLQVDRVQPIAEVGFWIGHESRGQGLAAPMLSLAIQLGKAVDLRGLVAMVDPANERTVSLLSGARWAEVSTKSQRRAFAQRW